MITRTLLLALAVSFCASSGIARGESDDLPDIDVMIDRGVNYIYSQQHDGNWETVTAPSPPQMDNKISGAQWTGLTALATYALLESGQKSSDPRIDAAIKFLLNSKTTGTYALGARCLVWSDMPLTGAVRPSR